MQTPADSGPTVNIGVRVEPRLLRQLHLLADRQEMSLSATARHLMVLGMEQLQTAA